MSRGSKRGLPFHLTVRPGMPIYEQLIQAVRKAMLSGVLRPGDKFPSVREISKELSINPNTVQKALSELVHKGLLEVHPGVGSVVAKLHEEPTARDLAAIRAQLEVPILEARSLGLSSDKLIEIVLAIWNSIGDPHERN